MALVKTPDFPLLFYPRTQINLADLLFDATGEKAAFIFRVEKTGSITDVIFRMGGVTTAQAVRVTLQTVLDTTGFPTGTLYGGSTAGVLTAPTAGLLANVLLGTAAAAVEGDIIAVVFEFNATVGNLNVSYNNHTSSFPYCAQFTTAWAKINAVPLLSLKYSDATYSSPNTQPTGVLSSATFNAASVPDEYALKFKTNVAGRITGLLVNIANITATNGTFDIVLYDANGTTVLGSRAIDPDILGPLGTMAAVSFTTPVSVPGGVFLYAAIRATGTGNVGFRSQTVKEAGQLVHTSLTAFQSSRTDAGAWADNTLIRPFISPIFSEIETGGGTTQNWGSGFF